MTLINLSSLPDPEAADLGGLPNILGWEVVGLHEQRVGEVADVLLHADLGGIVSLAVTAAGQDKTFEVPMAEVTVDAQHERIRLLRNLSEFGEMVPGWHDRPLLMRALLADYGVDEETIDALEAAGILTMEQLRAVVQRGGMVPLLGPDRRAEARRVERAIREQRL